MEQLRRIIKDAAIDSSDVICDRFWSYVGALAIVGQENRVETDIQDASTEPRRISTIDIAAQLEM